MGTKVSIIPLIIIISSTLLISACGESESIWEAETTEVLIVTPEISPTPEIVEYATPDRVVEGVMLFSVGEIIDASDIDFYLAGWWYISGNETVEPSDGNVWIAIEFVIRNKSSDVINLLSTVGMTILVDNTSNSYRVDNEVSNLLLDDGLGGDIYPGEIVSRKLGFVIPREFSDLGIGVNAEHLGGSTFVVLMGGEPIYIEATSVFPDN